MPKTKAELQVELREAMKGTPYKMPLSTMKLHELESAQMALAKMKAEHATAAASIPVVSSGRPKSRPIEPAVAADDDDEDAIKVPQAPKPKLLKAPPIRFAKDPDHPIGRPPKAKKEVKVEEPEPTRGKSPASHICNCPHCPTRK
jgi:hypothetical protein